MFTLTSPTSPGIIHRQHQNTELQEIAWSVYPSEEILSCFCDTEIGVIALLFRSCSEKWLQFQKSPGVSFLNNAQEFDQKHPPNCPVVWVNHRTQIPGSLVNGSQSLPRGIFLMLLLSQSHLVKESIVTTTRASIPSMQRVAYFCFVNCFKVGEPKECQHKTG